MKSKIQRKHRTDHTLDNIVGSEICKMRKVLHIPARELASIIGVTVQQVRKYETGENRLSSGNLIKIMNYPHIKQYISLPEFEKHVLKIYKKKKGDSKNNVTNQTMIYGTA